MREQISPDPIRDELVMFSVYSIRILIDQDEIENHIKIKAIWDKLSNDERLAVQDGLKDKAPDSGPRGRAYKSILKDYLSYSEEI